VAEAVSVLKTVVFFDSAAVKNATDERTRRALSRFGAFVRQRARRSMRTRRGPSAVGSPPSVHKGQLKAFVFFQWDRSTSSVVVGPTPFARGTAPEANEYGKASVVRLPTGRTIRAVYKPRPFMAPALAAELPRLADCFEKAGS
jgi:hypothetical protein